MYRSLVSVQIATNDAIESSVMEILCVAVKSSHTKLLIIGTYVPPFTFDYFHKDFTNFIEEVTIVYLPKNVILCGDFNLPNIRWTSEPLNYVTFQYICRRVISAADSLLHLDL